MLKEDKNYEASDRRSKDEVVAEGFKTINGDVYIHGVYVGLYQLQLTKVK